VICPQRRIVWWYGSPIRARLVTWFSQFDLELADGPASPVARQTSGLRTILIAHDIADPKALRNLFAPLRPFQDHGVAIRFVVKDHNTGIDNPTFVRLLGETDGHALTFDRIALLRACLEHDPGLDRDTSVVVIRGGIHSADLDPESVEMVLIQRSFADFEKVQLQPLEGDDGGKSGASVWQATAHKRGGIPCEPFILKMDEVPIIQNEKKTYDDRVRDQVAFIFRPGNKKNSIVKGRNKSLLVSMFVDGAMRYDRLIAKGSNPTQAIRGLFTGPLRNWRVSRPPKSERLGKVMVDRCAEDIRNAEFNKRAGRPATSVLPSIEKLRAAAALAPDELTPEQLWERLESLAACDIVRCLSHCDLNARNFFVRDIGEPVLIDFPNVDEAPRSRDIARIEIATAWDIGCPNLNPVPHFLGTDTLRPMYTSPLLSQNLDGSADPRIIAVRELRRQADKEAIHPDEFEVMIACHLLRYARYVDGESNAAAKAGADEVRRLRELSYRLAAGLIRAVASRGNGH
jgi:hypothetical protein